MKRTIYENKSQIPTKYITKKQTPETNEAVYLLTKAKLKYRLIIRLLIISSLLTFIILLVFTGKNHTMEIIFFSLFWPQIFTLMILIELRHLYLKPYYELLNTAINNDRIRHEERIKFRERKRLEQQEIIDYSKKEKYLRYSKKQTKNTLKEIKQLKTLKQEEQTVLRPQVNIEKIRELQNQLKNKK